MAGFRIVASGIRFLSGYSLRGPCQFILQRLSSDKAAELLIDLSSRGPREIMKITVVADMAVPRRNDPVDPLRSIARPPRIDPKAIPALKAVLIHADVSVLPALGPSRSAAT